MKQPQYKLDELKIFTYEELSEPYSNIYSDLISIELEDVFSMPECIKSICEDSINKLLIENYEKTGKMYTKDYFDVSMTLDLNTENGIMTICTYVGYWELDLRKTVEVTSLDCYEEIKRYFFKELDRITTARINQIKSMVA